MKRKKRDNIAHRSDNPSWNNWFPKYKSGPYIYLDSLLTGNPRIDNVPYGEGAKNYLSKLFGVDKDGKDHFKDTFNDATNLLREIAESERQTEQAFLSQNIFGDKLVNMYLKGNVQDFSTYIEAFNRAALGREEYKKRLEIIKQHYYTQKWSYTQGTGGYVKASINKAYKHEKLSDLTNIISSTTFIAGKTDKDMSALVRNLIMRELYGQISTLSDVNTGAITGIIQTVILPELQQQFQYQKDQIIDKNAVEQLVQNHPLIQKLQEDQKVFNELSAIGNEVLKSYRLQNVAGPGQILAGSGELIDAITGTVINQASKQIYDGNRYSFDSRNTGIGGEIEDRIKALVIDAMGSIGTGRKQGKIDTILEYSIGNIQIMTSGNQSVQKLLSLINQNSIKEMKKRGTVFTDLYNQINQDLQQMEQVSFVIHENIKDWSGLYQRKVNGVSLGSYGTTLTPFLNAIEALDIAGFSSGDIVLLKTLIMNSIEGTVIGTDYMDPLTKYLSMYATLLTFDDAVDIVAQSSLSKIKTNRSNLKVMHVFKVNELLYPASVLLELTANHLYEVSQEIDSDSNQTYKVEIVNSEKGEDPYALLANYDKEKNKKNIARWNGIRDNGENSLKLRITALHSLVDVINNLGLTPNT